MDDEEPVLDVVSEMITLLEYQVDTTKNGDEAIEKYKISYESGKPFDVTIMDLTIPGGMGGEEAVKKILKINSRAKVLVSSGYGDSEIVANYERYGFAGIINKPFSITKLEEVLEKVLLLT